MPLGARAYSILIGPGVIDDAGAEIARIAPGAKCAIVTDANVAPLYLDRLTREPRRSGPRARHRSSARPARRPSPMSEFARVSRRADRGAHRAARHRHRARRRGDRRSDRLLRRLAAPRRSLRPGPDDAAFAGRFERRRQDGHQLAARQEPGRRVPPAVPRACRFRQSRHAERARVPRRLRRGGQVRPDRRPGFLRISRSPLARGLFRRPGAGARRSRQAAPPRRASSSPTRPSRASGRCSISAIPSATPSRA